MFEVVLYKYKFVTVKGLQVVIFHEVPVLLVSILSIVGNVHENVVEFQIYKVLQVETIVPDVYVVVFPSCGHVVPKVTVHHVFIFTGLAIYAIPDAQFQVVVPVMFTLVVPEIDH